MIGRNAQVERFYVARSEQLRRTVAACVKTTDEAVIDDACQHAWLTLVRRPDVDLDDRGTSWLTTVAIREGWRLTRARPDVPSGVFRGFDPDPLELAEPPAPGVDTEALALDRIEQKHRLWVLSTLTLAERRVVLLQALGYTYADIARDSQLTKAAVNGHLSRARRKLLRRAKFVRP